MPPKRDIPIEDVADTFRLPIEQAATQLKTCASVLKRICRTFGNFSRSSLVDPSLITRHRHPALAPAAAAISRSTTLPI